MHTAAGGGKGKARGGGGGGKGYSTVKFYNTIQGVVVRVG